MDIMKFTALTAFVLAVSACNTVTKKDLGLVKEAPNEFMVMSRAPLSLPPEYDVRPVTQPVAATENGEKTVKEDKMAGLSQGERGFMRAIGANSRNDHIREQITTEMKAVYE